MMRVVSCVAIAAACGAAHPTTSEPAHDHHAMHGRGAHLAIGCDARAQAEFDVGFVALHNMDYAVARQAFARGAGVEPDCAMLHWGIAMTYFHPLWPGQPSAQDLSAGTSEAAAAERAPHASATDRDYIHAVAAFYDGSVDYATRLAHWAAAQVALAQRYPDDLEAHAFSALARLATIDKRDAQKASAASLAIGEELEQLLQQRPDHPGVMHYLLHAYDNPALAQHGVDIARKYAASSPGAAHALHMPSHIHVRLGNWREVIASNIDSAAAARLHPATDGRISRDLLHAFDYLAYGYLQVGDDAHAKEVVAQIDPKADYERSSGPGAYALAATPARFAIERHAWSEAAALAPRAVPYDWEHYPWAEAITYAARALGAAHAGDAHAAQQAIGELDRLAPLVESKWWQGRVQIERDAVAGWIAHVSGDDVQAERLLRSAAARERAAGKDSVEPGHVISAVELLGELMLELKRPADALEAFRGALEDSPKRFAALFGAGRAAELAGDAADAKSYYAALVAQCPDSTRAELAHARDYVAHH